jgi:hypothetical protein
MESNMPIDDIKLAIKQLAELAEKIDSGWFTQDHYRMEFDKLAARVASELQCSTQALPLITEPRFQRHAAAAARSIVTKFSINLVIEKGKTYASRALQPPL